MEIPKLRVWACSRSSTRQPTFVFVTYSRPQSTVTAPLPYSPCRYSPPHYTKVCVCGGVWVWVYVCVGEVGVDRFKVRNLSSHCGLAETYLTSTQEDAGLILALLSGLRCRSQTWLGSCVAVAVVQASGYSSNLTPSLGTSICCGCSPKKTK